MKLNNKIALVTGASTGIGRAVAIELSKMGVTVYLTSRNKEKLLETYNLIEKAGGKGHIIPADLSLSKGSLFGLAGYVDGLTDNLDVLVNVAGIWHGDNEVYANKNLEDFDENVVIDTVNVGLLAPMLLAYHLIPLMPRGSSIINVSGTFEGGGKGWLPYYASKRALEDLTIGLSEELKEKGIKVNCVSPSDTATEEYKKYFPEDAKNAQKPEVVAKFVADLSQKDVTGKVYVIKNGKVSEGFHK